LDGSGGSTSILDSIAAAPKAPPPRLGTLAGHPAFAEVAARTGRSIVARFEGHRILNRVLNDRGRFVTGLVVLDLGFGGADGAPLTATRLQDVCQRHGICSRGRARAMLAVLRVMRLLEPSDTADRRLRALVPTPAFVALHRERWSEMLATMTPILPQGPAVIAAIADDVGLAVFVRALAARFEAGFRVADATPPLAAVIEHASGLVTLLAILERTGGVPGEHRLVVTDLARRFLVSRGHVLEILRTAEAAGLLRIVGGTGATVEITPRFAVAFAAFFDAMFAAVAEGAEAVLARPAAL